MDVNQILPFFSTVIMFVFGAMVLQRFVVNRRLHNLFWGLGLLMFGVGSFAEAYSVLAWNEIVFRSWYVFGAMLNAGWLGHGTLLLLARRRWVHVLTAILVVLSLVGIAAGFTVQLTGVAFDTSKAISEQYKGILPTGAPVRKLTPIFNIYGTLFLVGGAIYSAYLFWRKRVMPHRVVGNILIAAGALVIASASTLTRLFFGGFLYIGELVAAVLMFAGFIIATLPAAEVAPDPAEVRQTA